MTKSFRSVARPMFGSLVTSALLAGCLVGCEASHPAPRVPGPVDQPEAPRPDQDPALTAATRATFRVLNLEGSDASVLGREIDEATGETGKLCVLPELPFVTNSEGWIAPTVNLRIADVEETLGMGEFQTVSPDQREKLRAFATAFGIDDRSVNTLFGWYGSPGGIALGVAPDSPDAAACGDHFVTSASVAAAFQYGLRIAFPDTEGRQAFLEEYGVGSLIETLRLEDLEELEDFLADADASLEVVVVQLGTSPLELGARPVDLGCGVSELEGCLALMDQLSVDMGGFLDGLGEAPSADDLQGWALASLGVSSSWF